MDFPESLRYVVVSETTRAAKNDFKTESGVRICVGVRGMVKTKCSQASMDSLSVSTLNFYESQYCANRKADSMNRLVAMRRNSAKASV